MRRSIWALDFSLSGMHLVVELLDLTATLCIYLIFKFSNAYSLFLFH